MNLSIFRHENVAARAHLSDDPGLGFVGVVDDLGVLGDLPLAADARIEVGPDAAARLAHDHLARTQVSL